MPSGTRPRTVAGKSTQAPAAPTAPDAVFNTVQANTVTAQRFVVPGRDGAPRATLQMHGDTAMLELRQGDGLVCFSALTAADGRTMLALGQQNAITLEVEPFAKPSLVLRDADGRTCLTIENNDGMPSVTLHSSARQWMRLEPTSLSITHFDGKPCIQACLEGTSKDDGEPVVRVLDGESSTGMTVSEVFAQDRGAGIGIGVKGTPYGAQDSSPAIFMTGGRKP